MSCTGMTTIWPRPNQLFLLSVTAQTMWHVCWCARSLLVYHWLPCWWREPLLLMWKKERGWGDTLFTWNNEDGDNNMGHHHLDDVAHASSWPSIVIVHPSGDVALPHCHCCWCAQWSLGWSSDGCGRWLLVAVVATHVLMRVEERKQ